MHNEHSIENVEQLEAIIGQPLELIAQKVDKEIGDDMAEFIQASPLVIFSTIDGAGNIDSSPKGDAPGFVRVENSQCLLIPERPGNKLAYGFRNILDNGKIGLIFLLPKTRETLRVKGTASISKDPVLLERLSAQNKPALLCTVVQVEECLFHCGKAMIRSKLWQPEHWGEAKPSLMAQQFAAKLGVGKAGAPQILEAVEENYRDELY